MTEAIKNFLKRFLPPPTQAFNREIERVLEAEKSTKRELSEQISLLSSALREQQELAAARAEMQKQQADLISAKISELSACLSRLEKDDRLNQMLRGQKSAADLLQKTERQVASVAGTAQEAVWADIFHDAVCQSEWLKDRTFYPGRWAVGYPFLYVLYRVLNETRPKRILELGLGQSTRMIGQYAAAFEEVRHTVVEHDREWIDFFQNDFPLSDRSTIVRLDREMVPFKEADAVRVFANFEETFSGQKFDFMMIDAPLGGDMKQYARIDLLGLLPGCLAENFVIMLDDYHRSGEAHTGEEIKRVLDQNKIPYQAGFYRGEKNLLCICSERLKFLASM